MKSHNGQRTGKFGYIVVIVMNRKLPINTIKRNRWDKCRIIERGEPMAELTTFWTFWSSESLWFWWSFSGAAGDDRLGNWQGWIFNEEQTATLTTEGPKSFHILSRLSPPTHPSDPPPFPPAELSFHLTLQGLQDPPSPATLSLQLILSLHFTLTLRLSLPLYSFYFTLKTKAFHPPA